MNYIYKLTRLPKELHFGGKAEALHRLLQNRAPVPEGYAIAAEAFVQGALCPEAEAELAALTNRLPQNQHYAVRSSAAGEDGPEDSFRRPWKREKFWLSLRQISAGSGFSRK